MQINTTNIITLTNKNIHYKYRFVLTNSRNDQVLIQELLSDNSKAIFRQVQAAPQFKV